MYAKIRQNFFFLLLFIVSLLFLGLVQDFLLTIFWAAVLAVIFFRTYRIIRIKVKGRSNLAASLTLLIIVVLVVLPLLLIGSALVDESLQFYDKTQSGELDVKSIVSLVQEQVPIVTDLLARVNISMTQVSETLGNIAVTVTKTLANKAVGYTQNIVTLIVNFFMMLYILFFFLRDGRKLVRAIVAALPMGDSTEYLLFKRFATVARATLKGSLTVAIVQGIIGGITFALLGIEGAIFWGMIMTLLSLLPAIGSALIWAPAAVILLVQGSYVSGIILILVGVFLIGLVDNILRPIMVGRDTKMPDYLILISTLGGIAWFGLSGFVIGPCIAALFITCWQITGETYGGKGG